MQVNHKFKDTNADFDFLTSPRFGDTRCLRATRIIRRGEEIFINYNYDLKDELPSWYVNLHRATYSKKISRRRRRMPTPRLFQ